MTPQQETQLLQDVASLHTILQERLPVKPQCELHADRVLRLERIVAGLVKGVWAAVVAAIGAVLTAVFSR